MPWPRPQPRVTAKGSRARLLYLVPTSGNPTGITRARGAARGRSSRRPRRGPASIVVEDDVYRELAYDAPAPPSLWSLAAPGAVVRLGSFSKTLAPGLRLGWLTADAATVHAVRGRRAHRLRRRRRALLRDGRLRAGRFRRVRGEPRGAANASLAARRDAMVAALRTHAPELTFRDPPGGYFLWLRLPDGLSRARPAAGRRARLGVSFLPGDVFMARHRAWAAIGCASPSPLPDRRPGRGGATLGRRGAGGARGGS